MSKGFDYEQKVWGSAEVGLSPKHLGATRLKYCLFALKNVRGKVADIGCGFGEFAGVFFDSEVEMGIDVSWQELVNAEKIHRYKKLTWADAREMPFQDNHFNTVLSVSVRNISKEWMMWSGKSTRCSGPAANSCSP